MRKGIGAPLRGLALRAATIGGVVVLATTGSVALGSAAVPTPTSDRAVAIAPQAGAVVGVAQPVEVTFAGPVTNRAAAERSIDFGSTSTAEGSFTWLSNDVVQWIPQTFWPAHSKISVNAGGASTSFETAAAVVSVADIDAHTFTVSIDDQVVREMPASMGKSKFPTPVGQFTALAKEKSVVMDSRTIGIPLSSPDGYKLTVADAVRVTWGGVYVHGAPWSVASQGNSNVSHGCINLSPDNAAWYYDTIRVGDPIIIKQ